MKSEGVILNTIDYKETSKIVHIYTKDGLMSIKALGALTPKKGMLGFTTIGNTVSFVATDAAMPSLIEYEVLDSIFKISEDFLRVKVFMVLLDVIKNIPPDTKHDMLYPYVKKTFHDLKTENPKKLLSIFLIKMLYAFGIAPNLKSCVVCNSSDIKFLSLDDGGAICKSHQGFSNSDELYIFREYYYDKKPISDYTACNYDALLKTLGRHYQKYTHLHLKLEDVILMK